jgi:arylformamidase
MPKRDAAWYESQYRNRLAVPDHPQIFARWEAASDEARRTPGFRSDVRYGSHAMQTLDLYPAQGECRAALLFLHGGYWMALDKREHGFAALEPTRHGVTVLVANYALCPSVTIDEIVHQVREAGAWLYRNAADLGVPSGELYLSGHSAGGHLTAMALATHWPQIADDLPARLFSAGLAISGVYDLRELVHVPSVNANVRLDTATARKSSPMFVTPTSDAPLYLAVGDDELPPFRRQQAQFARAWKRVVAESAVLPGENHYSILLQLLDPASPLFRSAARMMRLDRSNPAPITRANPFANSRWRRQSSGS